MSYHTKVKEDLKKEKKPCSLQKSSKVINWKILSFTCILNHGTKNKTFETL